MISFLNCLRKPEKKLNLGSKLSVNPYRQTKPTSCSEKPPKKLKRHLEPPLASKIISFPVSILANFPNDKLLLCLTLGYTMTPFGYSTTNTRWLLSTDKKANQQNAHHLTINKRGRGRPICKGMREREKKRIREREKEKTEDT